MAGGGASRSRPLAGPTRKDLANSAAPTSALTSATPIRSVRGRRLAVCCDGDGFLARRGSVPASPRRRGTGVPPRGDPRHAVVRTADVHPAGHEIRLPVSVEIAGRERQQVRGRSSNRLHGEAHLTVVLEPQKAWRARIVP